MEWHHRALAVTTDLCCPLQVYLQSYHQAMTRRLQELSEQQLETCDVYFLLDFLHNIYTRYARHRIPDWD